jgi:hypothetical protein
MNHQGARTDGGKNMKFTLSLKIAAALILGIFHVRGGVLTYEFSGPVSGGIRVPLTTGGDEGRGSWGPAVFGTITETLYYDPTAQTLRQVGSVTVSPSSGSFNFVNEGVVLGSATLTIGNNNGSFSFDHTASGVQKPFNDLLLLPVSGSGIYLGKSFSATWNMEMRLYTQVLAVSATSLTFSQLPGNPPSGLGLIFNVVPGTDLYDGEDGGYVYDWELGPAVAQALASDTTPPAIAVSATPSTLWPPNGKMVPVIVSGSITDDEPDGTGVNASTAAYVVTDNYGLVQPSGQVTLAGDGSYTFTIRLQSSRNGRDEGGRHYTITVMAQDNAGNNGLASTVVTVPHDHPEEGEDQ